MTAIELGAQDLSGAAIGKELGVDRIELCSALTLDGLTSSLGLIERAIEVGPDVHVLIRPRAGGFVYSADELALTLADVRHTVRAGAAGIVIGALDEFGMPDLDFVARCVEAADGLEVTFHRAIDVSADILEAASMLVGTGVSRILTSGGAESAFEGRPVLRRMVDVCGEQIQVQAGGGVTPENARAIAETGVAAIHFSARRFVREQSPQPSSPDTGSDAAATSADFGGYETTDPDIAAATVAAVRG